MRTYRRHPKRPNFREGKEKDWRQRFQNSYEWLIRKIESKSPSKSVWVASVLAIIGLIIQAIFFSGELTIVSAITLAFSLLSMMILIEDFLLKDILAYKSFQAMIVLVISVGGIFTHGMAEKEVREFFGIDPGYLPTTIAALTLSIALEPFIQVAQAVVLILFCLMILILVFGRPMNWLLPISGMMIGVVILAGANAIYTRDRLAWKIAYHFDFNSTADECPAATKNKMSKLLVVDKDTGLALGYTSNQIGLASKLKLLELPGKPTRPQSFRCTNSPVDKKESERDARDSSNQQGQIGGLKANIEASRQ